MKSSACLLLAWIALGSLPAAAGTKDQPRIDAGLLLQERIARITPPPAQWRNLALKRVFRYAPRERVWTALLGVMVQNGIVVHCDKQAGLLIVVSDLVTRGPEEREVGLLEGDSLLCNTLTIGVAAEGENETAVYLRALKPLDRVFYEKLATELYAAEKWRRLFRSGGEN